MSAPGQGDRRWHDSFAWTTPATPRWRSGRRATRDRWRRPLPRSGTSSTVDRSRRSRSVRATPSRFTSSRSTPSSWSCAGRSPAGRGVEAAVHGGQALPELASVYWRPLVDERALDRRGALWTTVTVAQIVPFVVLAVVVFVLSPLTLAVSLIALAKAWLIPALYAQRGANVLRTRQRLDAVPERRALGLLGDLVSHDARDLYAQTGLVLERGSLGVWLVGEAGALLVRPGGRRAFCYCVRVSHPALP